MAGALAAVLIGGTFSLTLIVLAAVVYRGHKAAHEELPKEFKTKVLALENSETNRWTRFLDMSSSGRSKFKWDVIIIQGKPPFTENIFTTIFNTDPHGVSAYNGVGMEDFTVTTHLTLDEAKDGLESLKVLVIPTEHIPQWENVPVFLMLNTGDNHETNAFIK